MSNDKATIKASKAQILEILRETSVGYHEKLFFDIGKDRLRVLAGTPGGTVVGYADYVEGDIEEINGDVEAIIDVPSVQDYVKVTSEDTSGLIELTFVGSDDAPLAEQIQVSSAGAHSFEVGLTLPASETAKEQVPKSLPQLFDKQNRLIDKSADEEGKPVDVEIETYVDSLDKIIDVVDMRDELEFYPVVIDEQGKFTMNVGTETRNYVRGELQGTVNSTNGELPSFENLYGSGFEEVTKELDGQVTMYLQKGSPLLIRKEKGNGTIRHVLGIAE